MSYILSFFINTKNFILQGKNPGFNMADIDTQPRREPGNQVDWYRLVLRYRYITIEWL